MLVRERTLVAWNLNNMCCLRCWSRIRPTSCVPSYSSRPWRSRAAIVWLSAGAVGFSRLHACHCGSMQRLCLVFCGEREKTRDVIFVDTKETRERNLAEKIYSWRFHLILAYNFKRVKLSSGEENSEAMTVVSQSERESTHNTNAHCRELECGEEKNFSAERDSGVRCLWKRSYSVVWRLYVLERDRACLWRWRTRHTRRPKERRKTLNSREMRLFSDGSDARSHRYCVADGKRRGKCG